MSRSDCLPCIVCGKKLENVFDEAENQASNGLSFQTYGQYGSTAFDPMDCSYLEINICDECIVRAGHEGKVLWSRERKMVTITSAALGIPTVIGTTKAKRALTTWDPERDDYGEGDDAPVNFDSYEEYETSRSDIVLNPHLNDEEVRSIAREGPSRLVDLDWSAGS